MINKLILLSVCLVIVSCTTNSSGPHEDSGLFGTVGALNSGVYEKKLADKKQRLESLRAQNKESQSRTAELQVLERQRNKEIQQIQKSVDISSLKNEQIKRNITHLSRQLEVVGFEQQKQQNQISLLNYENNRNAELNARERKKLATLVVKRNKLRKQLEILLKRKF